MERTETSTMIGLHSTKKKVAQKFTLVYVIHYGMLTVHMPFLRNVAALLKICFKNLEGIITSENI